MVLWIAVNKNGQFFIIFYALKHLTSSDELYQILFPSAQVAGNLGNFDIFFR